jgi:hypothetical protein
MITDTQFFLALLWFNIAVTSITTLFRPLLEKRIPNFYYHRKEFLKYQILILLAAWSIYSLVKILVK